MAIAAAGPIFDAGNFHGVLYGGVLLNRNQEIVDRVRDTVFQNEIYKGRSIGTATIFLKDIRISTNVLNPDGNRAIGTVASEEVTNHVLTEGKEWTDRAFVVNDSAAEAQAALAPYGVEQIVDIQAGGPATWDPALWARAVVAAMDRFGIAQLVGLTTPQGRDLLPRIAAQLDAPLVMDCLEVDLDRHVAKTSHYSGLNSPESV